MADEHETPTLLSPTTLSTAPEKLDLGQILVRDGLLKSDRLEECLRLQAEMAGLHAGPVPRLGELLVEKGYVTQEAIQRALSEQSKTILFCPRCNVLLNVDTRPDAVGYSCGRCEGPLQTPPAGVTEKTTDSSVIINSVLPVPPEVVALREDPHRRFGKYIILEQIGRGGIAEVWRAWDTYLHQYVALKRIQSLSATDQDDRNSRVASLLNEAHNAIRLRHPNIVSVYDVGRVGREYYISMEYLDGQSMYDALVEAREAKALTPFHKDPRKWMEVMFQVCHAVHYAHTRPIPTLHCDLKPGNIFITKEGRVCVLDFGLARQLGGFHEEFGAIVGTPAYMAPEQATGKDDQIDARTDVYGLGAVMYELLSGRPPFVGSMYEVLRRTVNERPVPPSHVVKLKQGSGEAPAGLPAIPEALEALCLRCLEKGRDARPPSALDIAKEIGAIAEGRAVTVTPSGRMMPDASTTMSAPAFPTPPPIPAVRVAPERPWIRWVAAAVVLLSLGGAAWIAAAGAAAARREQARRHLAEFRPELVHEGTTADPSLLQASVVLRAFKLKLVGALNARPPAVRGALDGDRAGLDVRVLRAKDELVVFDAGAGPDGAPWAELGPEGIAVLARACGLLDDPADRLGLALAHLYGGRPHSARPLLEALRGTSLDEEAGRWLARLPSKG